MKKTSYASFEEWQVDHERVKKAPNDKHLLAHVIKCIENSAESVKRQIRDYLSDAALETNPWMIFEKISREHPESLLIVRSRENPWFDV